MTDEHPGDQSVHLRQIMADRAIAEGRKRHALTVGELFPYGDVVAQWVFSVTVLAEDISVLVLPLRQAQKEKDFRSSLFFYRQLIARLYEARRIATTARATSEIAVFVGDLLRRPPGGGIDLEQVYRRDSKAKSSRVERLYAEVRHRTVHYLEPGSDELADALWDHSGYPAQIAFVNDEEGQPLPWFQWVHAVTATDLWGDVQSTDFLKLMKERSELAAQITMSWSVVAGVAVVLHAHRLGIDSSRLGQVPESVSGRLT